MSDSDEAVLGQDEARRAREAEEMRPPTGYGGEPLRLRGAELVDVGDLASEEALARRLRLVEDARRQLPCYVDEEAGRVAAAAMACERISAWRECPRGRNDECPRRRDMAPYERAFTLLELSRALEMDQRNAHVVLGAISGRRDKDGCRLPIVGLERTDAIAVAQAFVARTDEALLPSGRAVLVGRPWVVMAGPVGTGKTLGAVWVLAHEGGGLFVAAPELAEAKCEVFDRALTSKLLVLDEAGEEYAGANAYGPARISRLLSERYRRGLRTLVTTNLTREAFRSRYGERIDDRLNDGGRFIAIAGCTRRKVGR